MAEEKEQAPVANQPGEAMPDIFDLILGQVTEQAMVDMVAALDAGKTLEIPSLADMLPPPEAGISENFYFYDPDGVKHQFTIRAAMANEFASLLVTGKAMRELLKRAGWRPAVANEFPAMLRAEAAAKRDKAAAQTQGQNATTNAPKPMQQTPAATPPPPPAGGTANPQPQQGNGTAAGGYEPQPGEYGYYNCHRMVVDPKPDNKAQVSFYAPNLRHPVVRHTATHPEWVALLAATGTWAEANFAVPGDYQPIAYKVNYQYSPAGRRKSSGKLYKDLVSVELAEATPAGG